jgi:transposase
MRVKGSAEELEHRRRRALDLLADGRSLREVARTIGCDPSSVMRWRDAWREGGDAALKVVAASGRPRKLTDTQLRRLVKLLLRGPLKHGYATDLWTTARVAEVIERVFGVHYDPDHVGRLLHQLGWSHQKPERRATERDEEAIEEWTRKRWPQVKKTLGGWEPT